MEKDNVVRLPDLEQRLWADLEARARLAFIAQGESRAMVDAVFASLQRRCRGMPIKLDLPDDVEMTEELRARLDEAMSKWISDFAGFMIVRMMDLEIEAHKRR